MSTERERLVKILYARSEQRNCPTMEQMADALIAAGVTLPPEPPALVTEEMVREHSKTSTTIFPPLARSGVAETSHQYTLEGATALVESAIRRAVAKKTDELGTVPLHTYRGGASSIPIGEILALFGLEAV